MAALQTEARRVRWRAARNERRRFRLWEKLIATAQTTRTWGRKVVCTARAQNGRGEMSRPLPLLRGPFVVAAVWKHRKPTIVNAADARETRIRAAAARDANAGSIDAVSRRQSGPVEQDDDDLHPRRASASRLPMRASRCRQTSRQGRQGFHLTPLRSQPIRMSVRRTSK
jgi:hypothetical protein